MVARQGDRASLAGAELGLGMADGAVPIAALTPVRAVDGDSFSVIVIWMSPDDAVRLTMYINQTYVRSSGILPQRPVG